MIRYNACEQFLKGRYMSYINQIAYNMDRRYEVLNQELAWKLAEENNHEGIKEIA